MKAVLSLLALAWASLPRSTLAQEELIVRVNMPRADELPPADIAMIEIAKENMARRGRNLRSERRLDPRWCDRACQYVPFPYCQIWHPSCFEHRRLAAENMDEVHVPEPKFRELQNGECDAEKQLIRHELEQAVSSENVPVVQDSSLACFQMIDYCEITRFDLWNADTDTLLLESLADGAEICQGDSAISISAVADTCVRKVAFVLTGPGGFSHVRTEHKAPFFLYGNSGTAIDGVQLPVGSYTLTSIPDENSQLSSAFTFAVAAC